MDAATPIVNSLAAEFSEAQGRRGSPRDPNEELVSILKSGRGRRRRKRRRRRSLRWVNDPDERETVQQVAAAAAGSGAAPAALSAAIVDTLPLQRPSAGLRPDPPIGSMQLYTPAAVPAVPVKAAVVVMPPEQRLQKPSPFPPQGINYNTNRLFVDREEALANVAAISPADLSAAYAEVTVRADPLTGAVKAAPLLPSGASAQRDKLQKDKVSGFGGLGTSWPDVATSVATLFLLLAIGTMCLLIFVILAFADTPQGRTDIGDASAESTQFTDLDRALTNRRDAAQLTAPSPTSTPQHTTAFTGERRAHVDRPEDEGTDGLFFNDSDTAMPHRAVLP